MPTSQQPGLFVVDGSNIATEGRSQPSLEQLNEAVMAFLEEYPDIEVTVVVDATFGHRIAKKEVKAFDEAVANNELVTPPAGAVGRGDAFVLSIANKAKAGVLSNDSFQEFHGDYEWLFDEGRLVGGKPVPHVGWVWVTRTPVRGPKSRQAVKDAKGDRKRSGSRKRSASEGDATEAKEAANRRVRKKSAAKTSEPAAAPSADDAAASSNSGDARESGPKDHVNDLMPFLDFVEHHPVGTSCTAVVDSYASHGAYARLDDVLIYVPLRLMDDPPPRSARKALSVGDSVALVIVGFTPDRRSIDAALPHMAGEHVPADDAATAAPQPAERPTRTRSAKKKAPAKKTASKKAAAKKAPAKKAPAKKTAAKKAPAKKAAAKKTAAKKTAAKKAPTKKTAAKKTAAKKSAAKKAPAKKAPAKKTAAKKAPAKQATTKASRAKKSAAKKSATSSKATS